MVDDTFMKQWQGSKPEINGPVYLIFKKVFRQVCLFESF